MRQLVLSLLAISALSAPLSAPLAYAEDKTEVADKALIEAVDGAWRSPEAKVRDADRHPVETLSFWGLKPKMTVFEIWPGQKGWWTEILGPYAAKTSGVYIAGLGNKDDPEFWAHVADKSVYGHVQTLEFKPGSLNSVPDNKADLVLIARAFHGTVRREGLTDEVMKAAYRVLKPGGVLGVEQHRALEGSDPKAGTGYVPESYVIDAAQKAGFVLEAKSEINANPKDNRNHTFGVWTLKPVRESGKDDKALSAAERAKYDAIGESDRMTLRFKKPA
jgi:predicted methyltransferase